MSFCSLIGSVYYYFLHRFCGLSSTRLHTKVFHKFLLGKKISVFAEEVVPFLDHKLVHFWNSSVLNRLYEAKKKNHYLLLLSNSPDFLVSEIVRKLPIDEYCASQYIVCNGTIIGIKKIMDGSAKAEYASSVAKRLSLSQEDIIVYSDSMADFPLMQMAGKVVSVRKADKRVKKLCAQYNWEII